MNLLKYITIESGETLEDAITKINIHVGHLYLYTMEKPFSLAGNSKILKLSVRGSLDDYIKIDGPGFIINDLYNYFLENVKR